MDSPRPLVYEHQPSGMAQVVERNIRALLTRRHQEEQAASWQDRLAARITRFTGSMRFVYIHLAVYGLWIIVNLPWYRCRTLTPPSWCWPWRLRWRRFFSRPSS